jgi:Flp pilus assembly protein TadB
MAPGDGPQQHLRSWAVTLVLVSVAVYLGAHLIVAVAPVICVVATVVTIGYVVRFIVNRRRW